MEGDGKKRRSTMPQPDPSGLHKRLSTSLKTGSSGLRKCVRNNPDNDSSNSEADNAKNIEPYNINVTDFGIHASTNPEDTDYEAKVGEEGHGEKLEDAHDHVHVVVDEVLGIAIDGLHP